MIKKIALIWNESSNIRKATMLFTIPIIYLVYLTLL